MTAKAVKRRLDGVVAAHFGGWRQAMVGETHQQLANHRFNRTQQVDLLGAQTRTAAALEQTKGNLAGITDIGNEVAVFTAAGAQVIGLVVVTVEKVIGGDVFQVVKTLGQAAFHRQTERVEQIARCEVAIKDSVAVLLGNALLIQQLRRLALALEADHHRFDCHQLADRSGQVLKASRCFTVGTGALQRRVPLLQSAQRQADRGIKGCVAHAPQSISRNMSRVQTRQALTFNRQCTGLLDAVRWPSRQCTDARFPRSHRPGHG
ncbi:hypothetical protein D3C77_497950 [compost metagenome]